MSRVLLKHSKKRQFLLPATSNSVAIICKRYYVKVRLIEIGFARHGNNTYCKANMRYDEIIDDLQNELNF